jgi:hypothetical protein
VQFRVIVTNTGNVALTSVAVTDPSLTFTGVVTSLAFGASDTSDVLTVASVVGQHENTATVNALYNATPVTASDMAHYYVAPAPCVNLEKLVNGQDADSPTGPVVPVGSTVTFDFFVENCGNVALTNVVVTDDIQGYIGTIPSLAVGGNQTLTKTAFALAGQRTNMGNVTTNEGATDEDAGNYFGSNPCIDLEKLVNGQDADSPTGPVVEVGSTVTFDFFVENCGNVALTNVVVTDDVYGYIGNITSLAVGGNQTLTIQRTALAGQHTNMGNVTTNEGATDEDAGNYFGEEAQGCTLTWGYWKTHSSYGPAAHPDDTWNLIGVDSQFFISGQTYYEVLQTNPKGGNAYYILTHQYIAVQLNMLNDASSTDEVDAAMAWATTFFNTYTPSSTLSKMVRNDATSYAGTLDDYNNGLIGPGHCSE